MAELQTERSFVVELTPEGVQEIQSHKNIYTEDTKPIPLSGREWSTKNYITLWTGILVSIPVYMMASALLSAGLTWYQALFICVLGHTLVLIPSILLAIAIMAALGPGIEKAVVAIGLVAIPEYARIVRSEILSIKENDYVAAARVIGDSNFKIVFKHVLPNVLPSIIVRATLGISTAILDAAALGFLGLGVQPPAAEWGDMLGRGRNELFRAPWLMIFPGLAITLTVLAFNLLGDGVRDGLDPKARKR